METPEYFHGGFFRGGNPQCGPEKKAGGCGGGGEDQFSLEDLLDFSNEEEDETGGTLAAAGNSTDSSTVTAVDSCSNSFSGLEPHFSNDLVCRSLADASRSGDLCEPQYEELAELEWLSNFVEESFSSEDLHKLHPISGVSSTTTGSSSTTTAAAATRAEVSANTQDATGGRVNHVAPFHPEAIVPGKARSKRSRAAPCSWSSRLLVLSPSLATASSPESELIVPASAAAASIGGGGVKKAAKPASKKKDPTAGTAAAAGDGRKCLHCQTDKTPQWRTGPLGPKTLCNACGVRYKSGRLVPEYRPAASPTFVVSKHSNSHRKVLELRRQKELQQQQLFHAGGVASFYDGPMPVAADDDDFLIHGPDFRHLI